MIKNQNGRKKISLRLLLSFDVQDLAVKRLAHDFVPSLYSSACLLILHVPI